MNGLWVLLAGVGRLNLLIYCSLSARLVHHSLLLTSNILPEESACWWKLGITWTCSAKSILFGIYSLLRTNNISWVYFSWKSLILRQPTAFEKWVSTPDGHQPSFYNLWITTRPAVWSDIKHLHYSNWQISDDLSVSSPYQIKYIYLLWFGTQSLSIIHVHVS